MTILPRLVCLPRNRCLFQAAFGGHRSRRTDPHPQPRDAHGLGGRTMHHHRQTGIQGASRAGSRIHLWLHDDQRCQRPRRDGSRTAADHLVQVPGHVLSGGSAHRHRRSGPRPQSNPLEISTRVNGVYKQRTTTDTMIYSIPTLLEFLTRTVTLQPGDLMSSGTCGGTGMAEHHQNSCTRETRSPSESAEWDT